METILVIDDEPAIRNALCIALQGKGFVVLEADSRRQGILAAACQTPDLIVCDLDLPDGTGHDVLDVLKRQPATSAIPFIFMTGRDDPQAMRRGMEQGADDFLIKPFRMDSLLAAVDARLRRRAMQRAQGEQTERRLQAIVEANQDLVAMADVRSQQILYLNRAGRQILDLVEDADVSGLTLADIHPPGARERITSEIIPAAMEKGVWTGETALLTSSKFEVPVFQVVAAHKSPDGQVEFFSISAHDLTLRKRAEQERHQIEILLRHAQKLESIGQLAAGIAHEINTPTQFIGDNLRFMQDAFKDLLGLLKQFNSQLEAVRGQSCADGLTEEIDKSIQSIGLAELEREIPDSIAQALSGVQRVAKIVQAMKDFSHPGTDTKESVDLNRAIESTLTVCRNEWRYVANLETDFDPLCRQSLACPGSLIK